MDKFEILKNCIFNNYKINVKDFRRSSKGNLNLNLIITAEEGNYFAKIVVGERLEDVKRFTRAEGLLDSLGVPVIQHIKTKDNNDYVETEIGIVVVYPYVEGEIIDRKDLSPKLVFNAGVFLAKLHLSTKNLSQKDVELFTTETSGLAVSPAKAVQKLAEFSTRYEFINALVDLKKELLSLLPKDDISIDSQERALIHGDFQDENFFVVDNDIEWVFDLEKSRYSTPYIDISRFVFLVCFSDGFNTRNLELSNSFLEGYTSISEISMDTLIKYLDVMLIKKVCSLWAESEYEKEEKDAIKLMIENDYNLLSDYKESLVNQVPTFKNFIKK